MPAIFINPIDDNHLALLLKLNKQNQDLRVFISDKLDKNFIEKIPGKKAIGDIFDDSHISTACEGAYCGIFYEGSNLELRDIFIKAITESNLKRILWVSEKEPIEEILIHELLTYVQYSENVDYHSKVLNLEEVDTIDQKIFVLK